MSIDPPYRLDVFQNIINVNWQAPSLDYGMAIFIFNANGTYDGDCFVGGWDFDSSYYSLLDTGELDAYQARYLALTGSNVPYYGYILYEPPPNPEYFSTLGGAQSAAASSCNETHTSDFWSFYYRWNYVWQFNFSRTTPPKGFVVARFTDQPTA